MNEKPLNTDPDIPLKRAIFASNYLEDLFSKLGMIVGYDYSITTNIQEMSNHFQEYGKYPKSKFFITIELYVRTKIEFNFFYKCLSGNLLYLKPDKVTKYDIELRRNGKETEEYYIDGEVNLEYYIT